MIRVLRLVWRYFPRTAAERSAFLLGVREYRSDTTTNPGEDLIEAYDLGREIAHFVTFRRYDSAVSGRNA